MKISTGKVTAVVAAAALVVAGYALGTQGDGGAVAASSTSATPPRPSGPGRFDRGASLSALATKLGVSETALRTALDKVGGPRGPRDGMKGPGDGHGNHESEQAQALATALGVDVAKARDALTKAEDAEHAANRRGPSEDLNAEAASIAKALTLDGAKVKAALGKLEATRRAKHDQERTQHAAALAKALGLPTQKVVDALASIPHPGPHGPDGHGPGGPGPGPGGPYGT